MFKTHKEGVDIGTGGEHGITDSHEQGGTGKAKRTAKVLLGHGQREGIGELELKSDIRRPA